MKWNHLKQLNKMENLNGNYQHDMEVMLDKLLEKTGEAAELRNEVNHLRCKLVMKDKEIPILPMPLKIVY